MLGDDVRVPYYWGELRMLKKNVSPKSRMFDWSCPRTIAICP
jgi:hypothetical protein